MLILLHGLSYGDTPTYYRNYFVRQINMATIASDTKNNIFTIQKTFESILKWFIIHMCVDLLTLLLTGWIFLKFMHMLIIAKSRFELESPIYEKWVLVFELHSFFICMCITRAFLSNKNYYQVLQWTSLGFNKISFVRKSSKFSYFPCNYP